MDIELLIATMIFIVPMCFTPGPNNVLCAAHGSQHGFRATLVLISGMAVGWSALGLFVAGATDLIEDNKTTFDLLTYVGALYIAYLSYKIAHQRLWRRGRNHQRGWVSLRELLSR